MALMKAKSEVAGRVWQHIAKAGDTIAVGDTVMLIESMKMEIPVLAEASGTVREILVAEAAEVAEGQVVAIIEVG